MKILQAFDLLMQQEGINIVNETGDKGGLTKFGIAQAFHKNIDVANLTPEEAQDIYLDDYWNPAQCSQLPDELVYAHFSCAVNCGVVSAIKILQRAAKVADDGIIGPATLGAAKSITLKDYCIEWQAHYNAIVEADESQAVFAKGWAYRIDTILQWAKDGKLV